MNLLKQCLTTALLLLSLQTISQHSYPISTETAQEAKKKLKADSNWKKLIEVYPYHYQENESQLSRQSRYLKFRDEGLKFWKMFLNDPRRYTWFFHASGVEAFYWNVSENDPNYDEILKSKRLPATEYNLPINKKKLLKWEDTYPKLKKKFLTYCMKNPVRPSFVADPGRDTVKTLRGFQDEIDLSASELRFFLNLSLNKAYRKNGKIDLNKLKSLYISAAPFLVNERVDRLTRLQNHFFGPMETFLGRYKEYGLNSNDITNFLNSIKETASPVLRNWAIQKSSLFALQEYPFSLKHMSVHGDTIDMEKMRGKVVLVDFWSTNCSSCIERMPAIKAVYDKYKSQGFEVISACLANNSELNKIKMIEDKVEADWPLLMIGNYSNKSGLGRSIWNKYGFWGVPQYLLLDKTGKLVMYNDKLQNGDFEPIVKQLLTEKYHSN